MALQLRRGTDAERLLVVFAEGEPVWTTDTNLFYLGDGVTYGGVLVTGQNFDQYLNTTSNVIFADFTATSIYSPTISVGRLMFVEVNGNLELGYLALNAADLESGAVNNNVALGDASLKLLTNGYSNVAIGYASGQNMDSGNRNVFIGYGAGDSLTGGSNNNTIIGNETLITTATLNDTLIIGTGNTERLKVDDSGIYINGSPFSGLANLIVYDNNITAPGNMYVYSTNTTNIYYENDSETGDAALYSGVQLDVNGALVEVYDPATNKDNQWRFNPQGEFKFPNGTAALDGAEGAMSGGTYTVDSFDTTAYSTTEYTIQIKCGAEFETMKAMLYSDGTNTYKTEWAVMDSAGSLGTFTSGQSGDTAYLQYTPANSGTTMRLFKTRIPA